MMPHTGAENDFTVEGLGEVPGEEDEDCDGTKHDPLYRFIVKLRAAKDVIDLLRVHFVPSKNWCMDTILTCIM